ncbi:hypothetical protein AG1IA_08640 [Rhizoctonia solani AG-1 IA]|uniref:Uncharacterized protein n=1 Tax=Thanatephorus cucumeris (strain AG1-IA) TaxID=983506 RepID=L8WGP0_THACA|nr:hypothetical protein AG1IA_08640 [Rhizoctonia solani AG-1 IA]
MGLQAGIIIRCPGNTNRRLTLGHSMAMFYDLFLSLLALMPTDVATGFGHPNQGPITFRAKISPKPSMTPFTKGRNILIARDENRAMTRVRVGSDESKTERVSEGGGVGAG